MGPAIPSVLVCRLHFPTPEGKEFGLETRKAQSPILPPGKEWVPGAQPCVRLSGGVGSSGLRHPRVHPPGTARSALDLWKPPREPGERVGVSLLPQGLKLLEGPWRHRRASPTSPSSPPWNATAHPAPTKPQME
ncbi:unnamed protein product [Nyctereutes procyonoides]|uniref:(raccoon dog) hypothetical protein n=1 Tax=Nyctereutes procyonoides TaxID=34880 RepID=A0A811Z1U4_NYCPR|nr:unnamed protein product [Nyctereutes procyonoides]